MRLKLNYFIIPGLIIALSILGSVFTNQSLNDWYLALNLPSWVPSGQIIGIVWTIIFIFLTISILIFWNRAERNNKFWLITGMFLLNGLLNLLWSYLFFVENLVFLAFIEAILLALSVVVLIILLWSVSRLASVLLIPYALWVSFASFLTHVIWQLN